MSDLKLIWKPEIFAVGRQKMVVQEMERFLAHIGQPDWDTDSSNPPEILCETAGRVCYMSFAKPRPGGNEAYLGHILERGHGSVLEHAVFSFIVTGISRSLSHELIRHRAGVSVSELSQRFVDSSDVAFVVPPALIDAVRAADVWEGGFPQDESVGVGMDWIRGVSEDRARYERLADYLAWQCIDRHFPKEGVKTADEAKAWLRRHKDQATRFRKRAREAARSVLPNASETRVFLTANGRALRNVIEQRGSNDADSEIRRLAVELARVMVTEAPSIFQDVEVSSSDDGRGCVTTHHRKV